MHNYDQTGTPEVVAVDNAPVPTSSCWPMKYRTASESGKRTEYLVHCVVVKHRIVNIALVQGIYPDRQRSEL